MHNVIALLTLTFAFALIFSGAVTAANPNTSINNTIQQNITYNTSYNQTGNKTAFEIEASAKSNINTSNNSIAADPYNTRTDIHYTTKIMSILEVLKMVR
ncbi:MAG: hypothetical protein ABSE83_10180 [Methanobacterium sp.]